MEAKNSIELTLVNKYYPPDGSVTSEAAVDLTKFFSSKGYVVNIVCTQSAYNSNKLNQDVPGKVHRIKSMYEGKNKFLRLISSALESFFLIRKASKINAEFTIVMTSPPLLNYFVSLLYAKTSKKWIYWSLDLYPEAFKANKLVSSNNVIYMHVLSKSYSYPPAVILALGENQAQYLFKQFGKAITSFILPCGKFVFDSRQQQTEMPFWKSDPKKIYFGYIGNLGEAHSIQFLKVLIDKLDDSLHHMIMVVYGSKSEELKNYIKGKENKVTVLDFIQREELHFIDIHTASLKSDWNHICVPSKLVSAAEQGSCFLFMGPENSDSWSYLKHLGWRIDDKKSYEEQIVSFLSTLNLQSIEEKKSKGLSLSRKIGEDVMEAYQNLESYIIKNSGR